MSNYTVSVDFASKDNLISGNPLKLIKGADLTTEFTNIATAVSSKLDSSAPAIGAVLYPIQTGEVGVVNIFYPVGWLPRYGVDLTGVSDSTTTFQNAATSVGALGGGRLWHPGGTVMINKMVKLSSNTILSGVGKASLFKANPTYVGTTGGSYAAQNSQMIGNVNYAASALTDSDIVVCDVAFDWNGVTIAGGGAHSINLRFVDRVTIENVFSTGGENVTALLNCRDTLVFSCHGVNCKNCYFDHWDGAQSAHVISCTGRTLTGTTAQGIQFTGIGSYTDPAQSANALVAFCELYGIKGGGVASAIICNANGATSSVARFKTFGNYVENSDLGWVAQGAIGQAMSMGDTFRGCTTGSPIFFNTDPSGAPANCRVISPTLIDCSHVAGNIAMIVITGTNNRVENVNVYSPGGVLYTNIVWFPAAAVNCYANIDKAPNGITASRVNNQSSTSLLLDRDDLDAQPTAGSTPIIASAATIAPTLGTTFVSGVVQINTITVPNGCQLGGEITIIPSGGATWTTGVTGNIGIASTAVPGRALKFNYQASLAKWYPSY